MAAHDHGRGFVALIPQRATQASTLKRNFQAHGSSLQSDKKGNVAFESLSTRTARTCGSVDDDGPWEGEAVDALVSAASAEDFDPAISRATK